MSYAIRPFRIWSIQGTGTRFVKSFFHYLGFAPDFSHVGTFVPSDLALIIPKRHPYECYNSHVQRPNFDMAEFIGWWHTLIYKAAHSDSMLFPIAAKNEVLEKAVCEFVGIPHTAGFPWVPVGSSGRDRSLQAHLAVVDELQFAVDWFDDG